MDTAKVSTAEESTASNGPGPGGKLQAARVQLGMSIGDVASRMHLSNTILEALEDNNFDEITAPIFVKGYLRAYARIVSIDEESVITEYVELYSDGDPPITTTSNTASEISASDTRMKWMTYLVIIVLVALIAAWWWSEQQTDEQLISLDAEPASDSLPTSAAAVPQDQTDTTEAEVAAVDGSDAAADETTPAADEQDLPLLSLQPPEETVAEEPASSSAVTAQVETVAADNAPVITDSSASVTEPVTPVSSTAERQAPSGSDEFRLVVNADTWADIKDANGFQLIYDLMRADNTLVMTGAAPFDVFLGNGHGVDVEINGAPLDIKAFIRDDNTARFKTGG